MQLYVHTTSESTKTYKKRLSNLSNLKLLFPIWLNLYAVGRYEGFFEKLLKDNILDFNELVDSLKSLQKLSMFLDSHEIFHSFIENDLLTKKDIANLYFSLSSEQKFDNFIRNAYLIQFMLKNNVFDKTIVSDFENVLKSLLSNDQLQTVFDVIKSEYLQRDKIDAELKTSILSLNLLNSKIYKLNAFDKLTEQEKLEIAELIINSEAAHKKLDFILEHNVESSYSYEELKKYLTKIDKKPIFNV